MSEERVPIRLATESLPAAADALGRAFLNDPFVSRVYRKDETRPRRFARTARRLMERAVVYGEVQATSPRMEGVAVWIAPDCPEPTFWELARFAIAAVSREFDFHSLRCGVAYLEHTEAMRRRHLEGPHWYLQLLGVDPAHRGEGHAGALLRNMLARLDQLQIPCCLDTENETNVAIYEHFGFRVLEMSEISVVRCPCWLMARPVGGEPVGAPFANP